MTLQPTSLSRVRTGNQLPVIQVTAIYEDLEAGLRAKALMDCVQSGLELPAQLKLDLWRFDWLNELSIRNMALNIAQDSTLVVVSASTQNPFPLEMERWIRAWEQSRPGQLSAVVLVALAETGPSERHPLREALQRVSRQKGVDFYCEFFRPSHAEHGAASAANDGALCDMFRPRYERHAVIPPLGSGTRSARFAATGAFH